MTQKQLFPLTPGQKKQLQAQLLNALTRRKNLEEEKAAVMADFRDRKNALDQEVEHCRYNLEIQALHDEEDEDNVLPLSLRRSEATP